ncbi:MAG: SGNH/GDSL hydrolase family protein, partial [Pseudomonadota bacterium]
MNSIEQLVYFGDSLTDDGAIFELTEEVLFLGVPFTAAGYDGRFSDGPVYSAYATDLLGIENVETFAIASARAVGSRSLQDFLDGNGLNLLKKPGADAGILATDINIGAQVNRYLAEGPVAPGMAASLLIGLNDFNNFTPSSSDPLAVLLEAQALITDVVSSTLTAAGTLAAAGVETIILNTLPESLFFPGSQLAPVELQELGTFALDAHNDALIAGAAALPVEVKIVDFQALSAEIIADPLTFGFVAPLGAPKILSAVPQVSLTDGLSVEVEENPLAATLDDDQFGFFDFLHPTTAMHGVLGSFQAASLTHRVSIGESMVETGRGRDLVLSGDGDDQISTGGGRDIVFSGLGDDQASGQRGRDILAGGAGDDMMRGGFGADVVAGGTGDDKIYGGGNSDILIDGLGSDMAFGGAGADAFLFVEAELIGGTSGEDQDVFRGGTGTDTLVLALTEETRAAVEAELTNSR